MRERERGYEIRCRQRLPVAELLRIPSLRTMEAHKAPNLSSISIHCTRYLRTEPSKPLPTHPESEIVGRLLDRGGDEINPLALEKLQHCAGRATTGKPPLLNQTAALDILENRGLIMHSFSIRPQLQLKILENYKIWHFPFLPPSRPFLDSKAARVACSKTSRTPSFVFAEHSR